MTRYSQGLEQDEILRLLADHRPGRVLDIGAADGQIFSNSRALLERGWGGVLVEPEPAAFLKLLDLYSDREDVQLINAAVGVGWHLSRFWRTEDLVSTTNETHHEKWRRHAAYTHAYYVPVMPLTTLLIEPVPEFINIDVEGNSAELALLALRLPGHLQPLVYCIEHDGRSSELIEAGSANGFSAVFANAENVILETMNAILNVAVGSWYSRGQERLRLSLAEHGEPAERLMWREVWPGRQHDLSPYEFKLDAFDAAAAQNYDKALWCDSSVWLVNPLTPVWDWIGQHGVFLLGDVWNLGQWASDRALSLYGVDRDAAMNIQLTYNLVVGVDLNNTVGQEFLTWWRTLANQGAFVGPWDNADGQASIDPRCMGHRHDQSAASWLAHRLSIPLVPRDEFLTLGHDGPDRVFRAQGL